MGKKTQNRGFWNKVDLIELSDAFRRHAAFDNQRLVKMLVREAREIAVMLTHYRPEEGPNFPENRQLVQGIRNHLSLLVGVAWGAGIDEIVLPVAGDPSNTLGAVLREQVIGDIRYPVRVSLQEGIYESDLSDIGRIDRRIKTALDDGVRGMMNIAPALTYSW